MEEQIQENLQPTQPVQPEPVEPKKKSKLPLIVILLVVILLIAVGGIYAGMQLKEKQLVEVDPREVVPATASEPSTVPTLASTVDETANWKTYRNEKLGFSLEYPLTASISTPEDCQSNAEKNGDGGPCFNTTITLRGYKYPLGVFQLQSITGDSLTDGSWGKSFFTGRDYQDSTFKIGSHTAYSIEGILNMSPTSEMKSYAQYISVDGHEIAIWDTENRENKKIFDQILSTFKFTN